MSDGVGSGGRCEMRGVTRAGRALQPKLGASFPAVVEDSMEGVT